MSFISAWRVGKTVRLTSSFFSATKNDSAIALLSHQPAGRGAGFGLRGSGCRAGHTTFGRVAAASMRPFVSHRHYAHAAGAASRTCGAERRV